jgi:hypothetical protein
MVCTAAGMNTKRPPFQAAPAFKKPLQGKKNCMNKQCILRPDAMQGDLIF